MNDPRFKFIDSLVSKGSRLINRGDCDHPALRAQVEALTMELDELRDVFDDWCSHLSAERDKWRDIAERLYNATHESDYTITMRAARAYEQACND
jgi:hypothetical protein